MTDEAPARTGFLSPYRVLDLSDHRGLIAGRMFAQLGADVVQVEPPEGVDARRIGPFAPDGRSMTWAAHGAGKRSLVPTGKEVFFEADEVLIAIGQDNAFPWIERNLGIEFGKWDMPQVDERSFRSSNPKVFFGGDAAFGPANIITAVAHGHQAAVSIDLFLSGKSVQQRPAPGVNLISQKMGVHEWSYDNLVTIDLRQIVPHVDKKVALKDRKVEVELGFDIDTAYREAERCLNCDVQTVFDGAKCIECDGCTDICPTDCINFIDNAEEPVMRRSLRAPAGTEAQDLYVSEQLAQTERVMVKDENVCLHCGLCAERCPTGAWDMQRFLYSVTKAG